MGIGNHARRVQGARDEANERTQATAGQLPDELRASMASAGEEIVFLEEGVDSFVKGLQVQYEGKLIPLKKNWGRAAIAITDRHLVVLAAGGFEHLQVSHQQGAAQVGLVVERPDMLCLVYDASVTQTFGAGRVELRLHTSQAERIAGLLRSLAAG